MGKDGIEVSHIQFADDTLLFSDGSSKMIENWKVFLSFYEKASGMSINMEKSSIIGLNMDEGEVQEMAGLMGCKADCLPFSYLGVTVGGRPRNDSFWDPVVDRTRSKFATWKGFPISKGGRSTLIQLVLSSIPNYFLSIFRVPVGVCKKIEKMFRQFLWKGADMLKGSHLVNWGRVTTPRLWVVWELMI